MFSRQQYLVSLLFILNQVSIGQGLWDSQWYFGGLPSANRVDFIPNELESTIENVELSMDGAAVLSNEFGDLLFYSDGCELRNSSYELVENGSDLNPGATFLSFCPGGTPLNQSIMLLPKPGSTSNYLLMLLDLDFPYAGDTNFFSIAPTKLYVNEIDKNINEGKGSVIDKNQIALQDTLGRCCITAVKHGNGRDWFLLAPKSHSNCYFIMLIDPNGVHTVDTVCVGHTWGDLDNTGQASFSPNGKYYARTHIAQGLHLFNFDRCEGQLSYSQVLIPPSEWNGGAGVSFSPNSRFLYASIGTRLFQFDLEAQDIKGSQLLVGERTPDLPVDIKDFYQMQIAIDGKIYCGSTGSFNRVHVIHNPNAKGDSCNLEMGGLRLKRSSYFSLPQYPSFKLGPLDSSFCDTLGIDNIPVSFFYFRPYSGSLDSAVNFTNLSYGDVTTYHWSFGDGHTSTLFEPSHTYVEAGQYEICLTVSNSTYENTFCRPIHIELTGLNEFNLEGELFLAPNPTAGNFSIYGLDSISRDIRIKVYSSSGLLMYENSDYKSNDEISDLNLQSGLYYVIISRNNSERIARKLVIYK